MDNIQTNTILAPATLEAEPEAKTKMSYALQSRQRAQTLTFALETIRAAMNDTEISALMQAHGYDAETLNAALAMHTAAQDAFNARQQAIAAQKSLQGEWDIAYATARSEYVMLRDMARALFKDDADQIALGLKQRIPRDFEQFVPFARTTYAAARENAAYADTLATRGFSAETLAAQANRLAALVDLYNAKTAATADAARATAERNRALDVLSVWLAEFTAVARFATRDRPDLYVKLGL